jgi:hypothetical protein
MGRRRTLGFRSSGAATTDPHRHTASVDAADESALDRCHIPTLAAAPGSALAIAAALSAGGAVWMALQPVATQLPLDGGLFGSLQRWIFYLSPTLLGVWIVAALLDRMGRPGPGPVVTALALAASAVAAGTLAEMLLRLGLGRGDVLALDGVLPRVLELVRIDLPIGAIAALMVGRAAVPRRFRHIQAWTPVRH